MAGALGNQAVVELADPSTPGAYIELEQAEAGWQGATFEPAAQNIVTEAGPAASQNTKSNDTADRTFALTVYALRKYYFLSDRAQGWKHDVRISPYGKGTGMPSFTDRYLLTITEGMSDGVGTYIINGQVDGDLSAPVLN